MHCLKTFDKRNWDHVFPLGWYPDSTPPNIEKWKIPSCKKCNDDYGKMEDDLGLTLSLCVDPTSREGSGIFEKTVRALDPSQGKTKKDRRARARRKEQLTRKALSGEEIPEGGVYPGYEEKWSRDRKDQIAIPIPVNSMNRLVEKIIKGITYIESGRLVDENAEIEHHVVNEDVADRFEELLSRFGIRHSRGPGIEVVRAVTPEDGISAIYKITIWGQLVMYASIVNGRAQQGVTTDA